MHSLRVNELYQHIDFPQRKIKILDTRGRKQKAHVEYIETVDKENRGVTAYITKYYIREAYRLISGGEPLWQL